MKILAFFAILLSIFPAWACALLGSRGWTGQGGEGSRCWTSFARAACFFFAPMLTLFECASCEEDTFSLIDFMKW